MTRRALTRLVPLAEIAAGMLLLVVPFWAYLHFHAYSVVRPESLTVAALLALLGGATGACIGRTKSLPLRTLLTAALMLVSLDLSIPLRGMHTQTLVVLLGGCWLLRAHIHQIAVAVLVAIAITTFAFGPHEPAALRFDLVARHDTTRPPLLHLIADEHVGIEGIPTDIRGGREAQAALTAMYLEHGFRLYTRAYSQYYLTADVIPNELNFSARPTGYGWLGGPSTIFPVALRSNRYFGRLRDAGYQIRSYEPGFIDYCGSRSMTPASCYSVPANSLYNLPALGLPYASGTKFLFLNWVSNTSSLFFRINHLYQASVRRRLVARHIMLPDWPWNYYPLGPAAGAALLQRIGHDIGTMPDLRGTAFFGHLLLPHAPYYLREDCGVSDDLFKPSAPWEPFAMPRAERRRVYYERYFPQVRCLTQQVAAILDTLEKRGGGDAVVIIQGDHGARIGKPLPPMEQPLAREDFEDFYSTLFAVRGPGIMPGIDTSVVAIRDLLDRFSQTGFTRLELSQDPAPFVYRVPDVASALRVRAPIPSATDTPSPQAAAPVQALRLRPPVRSPLPAP